jgi:hypothetical protein
MDISLNHNDYKILRKDNSNSVEEIVEAELSLPEYMPEILLSMPVNALQLLHLESAVNRTPAATLYVLELHSRAGPVTNTMLPVFSSMKSAWCSQLYLKMQGYSSAQRKAMRHSCASYRFFEGAPQNNRRRKEYEMTEKERMEKGLLYDPGDA